MDLTTRWPVLARLCRAAADLHGVEVWAFGSMLKRHDPNDLDILVIYEDRNDLLALRNYELWEVQLPPVEIIAMTTCEERHYDFISITAAIRLCPAK